MSGDGSGADTDGFAIIPRWLLHDRDTTPQTKYLYVFLTSYQWDNWTPLPPMGSLVEITGLSEAEIRNSTQRLVELGIFRPTHQEGQPGYELSIYEGGLK